MRFFAVGKFGKINLDVKNERIAFCTVVFPLCVKTFVSDQQFRRYLYANNLHEKRKTHLCVKALIRVIRVKPFCRLKNDQLWQMSVWKNRDLPWVSIATLV